jgi:hypothetical protein
MPDEARSISRAKIGGASKYTSFFSFPVPKQARAQLAVAYQQQMCGEWRSQKIKQDHGFSPSEPS